MKRVLISNIQRFSVDDGPGIRTTIFFKGCSLACAWCHNPECIDLAHTLQFNADYCISCGACTVVCPTNAHSFANDLHVYEREKCKTCGICVTACKQNALTLIGQYYEPEVLLQEILKDRNYYKTSGGGVTFSGGEPALFPDFIAEIAQLCKDSGLHIALDTAGHVPFAHYEKLLPYINLFLYDVKCIDAKQHERWIGADNRQILHNLQQLDQHGASLVIRVPVIKGFNDNLAEHQRIASFLASLEHVELIQLLPYHNYGLGKYEMIGMNNVLDDHTPPENAQMEQMCQPYLTLNLPAQIS